MELWLLGVHSEESKWGGMVGVQALEPPEQCRTQACVGIQRSEGRLMIGLAWACWANASLLGVDFRDAVLV